MQQPVTIVCPYCYESVVIWLAVDDVGEMYYDCEVCCRPWHLTVHMSGSGDLVVSVKR